MSADTKELVKCDRHETCGEMVLKSDHERHKGLCDSCLVYYYPDDEE